MRDANSCVNISQGTFEKLIREDTRSIVKTKQAMIREDGTNAKEMRVKDTFMRQGRMAGMGVYELHGSSPVSR